MTPEFVYSVWAPEDSRWAPWVKPVLFSCMTTTPAPQPAQPELWETELWNTVWAPRPEENAVLVLDLPGSSGVHASLALAERGYRPVPLYNALPMPTIRRGRLPAFTAVDVDPIVAALWHSTERLMSLELPSDAPPVFLLDASRRGAAGDPPRGAFDNRSVSFITDFPSANFLLAHRVQRAVLVQSSGTAPQPDLAHTLRRWQEGGVRIELKSLEVPGGPVGITVPKPSWFGWVWQRVLAAAGLRRAPSGGFGGWLPQASAG